MDRQSELATFLRGMEAAVAADMAALSARETQLAAAQGHMIAEGRRIRDERTTRLVATPERQAETAAGRIDGLAKTYAAKHGVTHAAAVVAVVSDPANRALYAEHVAEQRDLSRR